MKMKRTKRETDERRDERSNARKEAAVAAAFDRASRLVRGEDVGMPRRPASAVRKGRTAAQRAIDQYAAVHLSVQGYSHDEIAEAIGITPTMVQNDLAGVGDIFRRRAAEAIDEHRGKHLMMLDAAVQDCWREWHRSKRDINETVTEARKGAPRNGTGAPTESGRVVKKMKGQTADVNYIFGMVKAMERTARLAGLDKPVEAKVYTEAANAALDRVGNVLVQELSERDPELLNRIMELLTEAEHTSNDV